ncbi:metal-dependent hydrolase [Sinimarinibacterium sp. NLF-5-8]|uniref:metal-dependent hydrolase n=1 Tax=Sinimarinibacterium sp. NLF-5-8 TaxID=2698684 RepID=UPI00137BAB19|nr:metal-dependent hydrolase [Sinimarinibacterium sp. NLF-5-8]QHS11266.1 metal-dependent hydrolase [Sinimarinibacterium sp. NLF-5-8]
MSNVKKLSARFNKLLPTRRDVKFNLPADRINDWHESGGPQFTAFLNTFSVVLPVGERFFIDSVRAHRDFITDPELKKAVTAFIGQEAMHGREHEEYNNAFFARSKIAPRFEKLVSGLLNWGKNNLPPSARLSATIALEHFTALLADSVLREPRLTAPGVEPHFSAVWHWHALEETEHKGVAYDVWDTVMGRGTKAYALRSGGMVAATVIFWALTVPAFLGVLAEQGKLTDVKGWRKFYTFAFGDVGLLSKQLGAYVSYFRPGFHPWDHDNSEYLATMDSFLAEQAKAA